MLKAIGIGCGIRLDQRLRQYIGSREARAVQAEIAANRSDWEMGRRFAEGQFSKDPARWISVGPVMFDGITMAFDRVYGGALAVGAMQVQHQGMFLGGFLSRMAELIRGAVSAPPGFQP